MPRLRSQILVGSPASNLSQWTAIKKCLRDLGLAAPILRESRSIRTRSRDEETFMFHNPVTSKVERVPSTVAQFKIWARRQKQTMRRRAVVRSRVPSSCASSAIAGCACGSCQSPETSNMKSGLV